MEFGKQTPKTNCFNWLRTTGGSFYADTNEVTQGRYEIEFTNNDGQTCIDVKDFI